MDSQLDLEWEFSILCCGIVSRFGPYSSLLGLVRKIGSKIMALNPNKNTYS